MNAANFYDIYLDYQKRCMKASTMMSRTSLIKNHFLTFLGGKDLNEITSSDIDAVYEKMREKNLAQNSIFGMYAAIMSFFTLAVDMGYASKNPALDAATIRPAVKQE